MFMSTSGSIRVIAAVAAWFGIGIASAAASLITTDLQITSDDSGKHAQAVIQWVFQDGAPAYASGGVNFTGNVGHLYQSLSPNRNTNTRYILRFDLPDDLDGATIQSATLKLYSSGTLSPGTHSLHRVTSEWVPATGFINWTKRGSSAMDWTTPGGDYEPTPTATLTPVGGRYNEFDVTADVQAFADGDVANYGWIIIGTETDAFTNLSRYGSYTGRTDTANQMPTLSITYVIPEPGAVSGLAIVSAGFLLRRRRHLQA